MEYALLIALALGLFLIVLAWLMVTIAGFRHHFVTGIVAMIPVVNVLILPTVWHRAKGWFYTGLVGLILAVGAWIGGANSQAGQHMQKLIGANWFQSTPSNTPSNAKADTEPPQTVTQSVNMSLPIDPVTPPATSTTEAQSTNTATIPLGSSAQHELPTNALYQVTFQTIDNASAGQYIGQVARVLRKDQKRVEGRLLGVTDKILRLEQNQQGQVQTQEIETQYIQSIEVLKH